VNTEHLVFMKQLLENAEYANENGVLNVIKLLKHEDSDVREGTSFAAGAFETLRKLLELRPDLLTPRVTQELEAMSQDNDKQVRSVAQAVLGR
jgi:HEAT repeat protein